MRRLPHLATLLRPTTIVDDYGDEVPGPLAPVGNPLPAWLQVTSSTENLDPATGSVITFTRLYLRPASVDALGTAIAPDDVLEVNGTRYAVDGDPRRPVNPRGRARFVEVSLKKVTHG